MLSYKVGADSSFSFMSMIEWDSAELSKSKMKIEKGLWFCNSFYCIAK